MYNRYIRSEDGSYSKIEEEEPCPHDCSCDGPAEEGRQEPPCHQSGPPPRQADSGRGRQEGLSGFLRHSLDQLHLDSIDTGDLLLLGLLFFLAREDADEELLIALGLLLIL